MCVCVRACVRARARTCSLTLRVSIDMSITCVHTRANTSNPSPKFSACMVYRYPTIEAWSPFLHLHPLPHLREFSGMFTRYFTVVYQVHVCDLKLMNGLPPGIFVVLFYGQEQTKKQQQNGFISFPPFTGRNESGWIIDNDRNRQRRRKNELCWVCIPLGLSFFLCFSFCVFGFILFCFVL